MAVVRIEAVRKEQVGHIAPVVGCRSIHRLRLEGRRLGRHRSGLVAVVQDNLEEDRWVLPVSRCQCWVLESAECAEGRTYFDMAAC